MEEKHQKRVREVSADEKGHLIKAVAHYCGFDRQEAIPQRGESAE